MPLTASDILVYDGNQWVNQPNIDGATFYVLTSYHRVGIGTIAPSHKLQVVNQDVGADDGITVSVTQVPNLRLQRITSGQTYILRTDTDNKFKIIDELTSGTPTRLILDTSGRLFYTAPASAPTNTDIPSGSGYGGITAWIDEGTNKLTFQVRYSGGGTTYKTGTVNLT